jgi:hypothetical protein
MWDCRDVSGMRTLETKDFRPSEKALRSDGRNWQLDKGLANRALRYQRSSAAGSYLCDVTARVVVLLEEGGVQWSTAVESAAVASRKEKAGKDGCCVCYL